MESGGQKTPGSLLRIKVSCNRDRRLLEAVGRSCKGKEKGGRGEQTRRTNRKGRPLATSPDGQKKEIHAFCQEKILLHQRDTETNTRKKGNNHERRGRTSPSSPGLPPPSNAYAVSARSGRFFEADRDATGLPSDGHLSPKRGRPTARRSGAILEEQRGFKKAELLHRAMH